MYLKSLNQSNQLVEIDHIPAESKTARPFNNNGLRGPSQEHPKNSAHNVQPFANAQNPEQTLQTQT